MDKTLIYALNFIGESPAFQKIVQQCSLVSPHDITVLLLGETGTGKEVCARVIHQLSPRVSGPFIPIDCAALPETLFAHELFGHGKGAFTDAREAKTGLIALSAGGTLFLDEVESLSLGAQGVLLRLLENKTWRPLGSPLFQPLNCRIIAATNQDLLQLVQARAFRADLYYRLIVSTITIPPLRERREDIPLLVRHFLSLFGQTYKKEGITLSERAMMALCTQDYPGNIRELQNILQQAIIQASGPCIELSDLNLPGTLSEASGCSWGKTRRQAISAWEKAYISKLLSTFSGNIASVARHLGVTRQRLYQILKRHQLPPPSNPRPRNVTGRS